MPYFIILCLFLLPSPFVYAQNWQAKQGDLLEISLQSEQPIEKVLCMKKTWPFKRTNDGLWHAWIGIDLKQKSADYPIIWQTKSSKKTDTLHVHKGKFRISRITVTKKMSQFDAAAIKRIRADQQAIRDTYDIPVQGFPDFQHMVMPVQGIETTPFGAQRYVNGQAKSPHAGVDIAAKKGTPILAPWDGQILLASPMFLNGNLIAIGHGQGLVTVYAHLNKFLVHEGEWVKAGQMIGEVGSTGRSTGPHLHWGMRFHHARINPKSL